MKRPAQRGRQHIERALGLVRHRHEHVARRLRLLDLHAAAAEAREIPDDAPLWPAECFRQRRICGHDPDPQAIRGRFHVRPDGDLPGLRRGGRFQAHGDQGLAHTIGAREPRAALSCRDRVVGPGGQQRGQQAALGHDLAERLGQFQLPRLPADPVGRVQFNHGRRRACGTEERAGKEPEPHRPGQRRHGGRAQLERLPRCQVCFPDQMIGAAPDVDLPHRPPQAVAPFADDRERPRAAGIDHRLLSPRHGADACRRENHAVRREHPRTFHAAGIAASHQVAAGRSLHGHPQPLRLHEVGELHIISAGHLDLHFGWRNLLHGHGVRRLHRDRCVASRLEHREGRRLSLGGLDGLQQDIAIEVGQPRHLAIGRQPQDVSARAGHGRDLALSLRQRGHIDRARRRFAGSGRPSAHYRQHHRGDGEGRKVMARVIPLAAARGFGGGVGVHREPPAEAGGMTRRDHK